LLQEQWEIHYIGSKHGIERQLIGKIPAVHYHAVATGKLRRYWAWANISDVFKIMLGVLQAYLLILRIKPHVCFSLGGFVAVPAVMGARWNRVPVLILEPDLHPGLANRLSRRYAQMMCTTFMDTATFASSKASDKMVYVGPVIREELKLLAAEHGGFIFADLSPTDLFCSLWVAVRARKSLIICYLKHYRSCSSVIKSFIYVAQVN
jgi:UDP-N-acetylglucosamine--N-acetylmuramyl-(pentapeptide) pyrophosphoryl-undecaprenol N-acetylglucosamine transferase